MAKLTKKDVLHVADLAKLDLSPAELKKYLPQLIKIVDHVSELSKVDTEGVTPTSQTTGLTDVGRGDDVSEGGRLNQEQATSGSESVYNGYIKVKAILAERSDK